MATVATKTGFTDHKVSNFQSTGSKVTILEEYPITEVSQYLSAVRANSNGTPYVWLNIGEIGAMVYFSGRGAALLDKTQNQVTTIHALQVRETVSRDKDTKAVVKDENGAPVMTEFYVITLRGETIENADAPELIEVDEKLLAEYLAAPLPKKDK
jgi:hypothetical protein